MKDSLNKQLKNNLLAILSLIIAISALGYNSWRNELSEQNRNVRYAGFEIIKETAKLQRFIDLTTFEKNNDVPSTPIEGWIRIRLVQSLSVFMNQSTQSKAHLLFKAWEENWQNLEDNSKVNKDLTKIIDELIDEVRLELSLLK